MGNLCFAGMAIYCFNCESRVSWSDCDLKLNATERTCAGPHETRCIAVTSRPTPRDETTYKKGCATRLHNPCNDKRKEDCESTLCDKDLCNFALSPGATHIAAGFRCYVCASTVSWKDCDRNAVEVYCGVGYRKCFKRELKKSGGIEYSKGCTVPLACGDSAKLMPDAENREILCCGQHLCNGAGIPIVYSGVLLLFRLISVFTF